MKARDEMDARIEKIKATVKGMTIAELLANKKTTVDMMNLYRNWDASLVRKLNENLREIKAELATR